MNHPTQSTSGKNVGPTESGRPTLGRLYVIAADLDDWNPQERAFVKQHPEWLEYRRRLTKILAETDGVSPQHLTKAAKFADFSFHV